MSLRRLTSASKTSGDIKRASPIRFLQIATGKVSVSTGSSLGLWIDQDATWNCAYTASPIDHASSEGLHQSGQAAKHTSDLVSS
jgi:hypothetical protein